MSTDPDLLFLGTLAWARALDRPDLLAAPVADALLSWSDTDPAAAREVRVAAIDPDLADTAAMTAAYGLDLEDSVNCVLVAGRRQGTERVAAAAVRATTRADVNGTVRRLLDVRKASFWPVDRAVAEATMEYGGITPIGLPTQWRLLLDDRVLERTAIIGSGVRRSKVVLPGELLARLPGAEVVPGLAVG
jgi:prolyl-tRNA editing enzyme YbaK/EbsC (Cys-tRNA(Pro) deacylase)